MARLLPRRPSAVFAFAMCAISMMNAGCSEQPSASATAPPTSTTAAQASVLDTKIRRFAPVDISAPVASLPENERRALSRLIDAARLVDGLFLEQVWSGNVSTVT